MLWPVPGYYAVHPEGHFDDLRSYGLHAGIDIPAPSVPTVAVADGSVIYTDWAGSAGRSVYIDLDGGYRVHYCHLSRIDVTVGQRVEAGDVIGLIGGSGDGIDNRWGSHLHLNLFMTEQPATGPSHYVAWVGMWAVDPELYLKEDDMGMTPDQEIELKLLRKQVNVMIEQIGGLARAVDPMTKDFGYLLTATEDFRVVQGQVNQLLDRHPDGAHEGGDYSDEQAVKAVKDALPG